jgi:acetyl-CoA synthetase
LEVIVKHKVTQFYTAPTAIRAKESLDYVQKYQLDTLKVILCREPINEEAWHWYNDHVGDKRCPVVDTWWQTEQEVFPIPFVTLLNQRMLPPLPGIQPVLMDEKEMK